MKKNILIGILLVTNMISLFLVINSKPKEMHNYFLSLSGESENWKINDYKIIYTPEQQEAGGGILTYTKPSGDYPLKVKLQLFNNMSDKEPFHTSERGIERQGDYVQIGGGGYSVPQPTLENLRSKYIHIIWTTKSGEVHQEDMVIGIQSLIVPKVIDFTQ
ncbi:hypothetical protein [Aneurinibacillus tyrosinisolvens]|uniref:hypothetical protein n=1 Tax=Aneurinibacillus tyrosinisolvens TaxID=1443435 RepID=UPI00063EFF80|nr:hypothetical protein [Aneurinibacillus tyrosinisolvens]